jgi:hypothetical protein
MDKDIVVKELVKYMEHEQSAPWKSSVLILSLFLTSLVALKNSTHLSIIPQTNEVVCHYR